MVAIIFAAVMLRMPYVCAETECWRREALNRS